jgi:bifunctional non-homologous end joining protein LigD
LAPYRAKRDFSITAEPSGTEPPPASGHRFVVQRHRASRLHYDLRLEMDGVLVSWAVPKGPTLDPAARHLAVHVEDHPLDYFDFEGVIPAGEYGGGDVVVWDWGTWTGPEDPVAAVEAGDLHVDLHGEKLGGRFVLVRRGRGDKDWLLLHKKDEAAVAGWDPEDHPRSVKSGRTNDEVRAAPTATWTRDGGDEPTWDAPTDDELAALDDLGREGDWDLQGRTLRLTNLDKVLFPGRGGEPPVTKRELVRHHACIAPHLLPYLTGRALNLHRYPNGAEHRGFWQKEVPDHAPDWLGRWRNPDADPGETTWYVVAEEPAALAWLANHGALELHPWTSPTHAPDRPSWALVDLDPGTSTSFDDLLVLARLHRTALEHLGVAAAAKVSGRRGIQIWVPVAERYTFPETRAWVESLSRAVGATVPDLVSWAWVKAERGGLARLDYTQNAVNKTLVAPFSARPAPGAPVSMPITWDELDDPDLAPDRWTIRSALDRLAEVGDPLRPLIGLDQELPPL